ncbi:winged helix-turn-helix domain-containing protein [Candidatus Pacearchaeota archaeon]|nr:winged helix-turn-helix domain-containing protein [Candidatus Pacearchaeota archaeon]
MKKIEQVYREILFQAIENKKRVLTQLELSKKLGFSLSTINLAVKKLEKMNSIIIGKMNFRAIDAKKILYLWASTRNIEKDIIYKTRAEMPVTDIEKSMPEIVYGAYSAYKFKFEEVPADYSEVYVYASHEELEILKKRFPENGKVPNLFVLKSSGIEKYSKTGTIAQIFVDLWNLQQWYASDFLKALEERLKQG